MNVPINAKRLGATLPDVVERVRKGTRFTVIYVVDRHDLKCQPTTVNGVVIDRRTSIIRRTYRSNTMEGVVPERNRCNAPV